MQKEKDTRLSKHSFIGKLKVKTIRNIVKFFVKL